MSFWKSIGKAIPFVGPIIGAITDRNDRKKEAHSQAVANEQNVQLARERMDFDRAQAEREYERQKEFAQMGIRWKAEDTRAAGMHPLAAIGGMGASYSPTITAGAAPEVRPVYSRSSGSAFGSALSEMGQNLARAQAATQTPIEREMEGLAIRNAQLRNANLEMELTARAASLMGQPLNPPAPAAVGAATAPVTVVPRQVTARDARDPGLAAGSAPAYERFQVTPQTSIDVPNQALAEGLEAMPPGTATWMWVNRAYDRAVHGYDKPSASVPGHEWQWSVLGQKWNLVRTPSAPYVRDRRTFRRTGRPSDLYDHR